MRIFLLGFMGTGKSHWGQLWSLAHNVKFVDLDKEIEKESGLSVADIFEKKGEAYFRRAEAAALRSMITYENCIIACGGGAPCFMHNMNWMNDHGRTIFLSAKPAYLFQNIEKEKGKRPLLKDLNEAEMLFFIEQKLKERMPFYSQATVTVNAEELTEGSFEDIVKQLTNHHA